MIFIGYQTINLILLLIFICAVIGNILGWGLHKIKWVYVTKPLLMPVLLIYYLLNAPHTEILLGIALVCAFLGDFFLLWPHKKAFFTLGLVFFLAMQTLYLMFIITHQIDFSMSNQLMIWAAILFMILAFIIYAKLFKHLRKMKIPLLVYMLVIIAVAYFCFLNFAATMNVVFALQFAGAVFFIISDTILAFDSFKKPLHFANVWIMSTYITAQLLLFIGFMNS